jgi:hypothetical protein
MMYQKQKGLAMNCKNLSEIYIIDNKTVSTVSWTWRVVKKKGGKMKVTSIMLLKTNGEKMSVFRLSKMLMKTNELNSSFQDVDENKVVISPGWQGLLKNQSLKVTGAELIARERGRY